MHVEVAAGQEHLAKIIKDAGLVPVEVAGEDQI
jgi:hypothetical protein